MWLMPAAAMVARRVCKDRIIRAPACALRSNWGRGVGNEKNTRAGVRARPFEAAALRACSGTARCNGYAVCVRVSPGAPIRPGSALRRNAGRGCCVRTWTPSAGVTPRPARRGSLVRFPGRQHVLTLPTASPAWRSWISSPRPTNGPATGPRDAATISTFIFFRTKRHSDRRPNWTSA